MLQKPDITKAIINNNNNNPPNKEPSQPQQAFSEDDLIKDKLKEIGEPIIYYGEGPEERKRRMIMAYQKRGLSTEFLSRPVIHGKNGKGSVYNLVQDSGETFYTEGNNNLQEARIWISQFSLPRAQSRLIAEAKKRSAMIEPETPAKANNEGEPPEKTEVISEEYEKKSKDALKKIGKFISQMVTASSEVGDQRAISNCHLHHNGTHLATSSWSGLSKIWRLSDNAEVHQLRGHSDRVSCIRYHPLSHTNPSPHVVHLATSSLDCTVKLWALSSVLPIATLDGHESRVNRVAWHPSGRFLASTSFDTTWRLWDLEKCVCLLEQDGHRKSVYAVAFQGDGSLIATAGADAIGRVWDLRTGRSVYTMKGHSKQIVSLDWSPNGYSFATGSEDNSVRLWDLRKKRMMYTFPAHTSVVSSVKFDPTGDLLFTASFDGYCKFWSTQYYNLVGSVETPSDAKIMAADVSNDLKTIVTANYDRTWKLYKPDNSSFSQTKKAKMEIL